MKNTIYEFKIKSKHRNCNILIVKCIFVLEVGGCYDFELKLSYEPSYLLVGWLVGWSVRYNVSKGREVALPCTYRGTGLDSISTTDLFPHSLTFCHLY